MLVVPHTHWDREWYEDAGRFRQRLVALVDELLDGPAESHPPTFLLDGQAVVLEDYLAVRPERRARLAEALRSGRLEAGPWYVLADNLIPGAESLVRNMTVGRRVLEGLGASAPAVCWAPDAFGHPAVLPTIAAGFGQRVAVVWRGYGGDGWPEGDAAWWTGPDGNRVLLVHLPPDGYEFGSRLPADVGAAAERWAQLHGVLAPRARLGFLLVLNGADHHALQERWPEALAALATAARPHRVEATSLAAVAEAAWDGAARVALPTVHGELRRSTGHTWALQGTFATRAAQKRRVRLAERRLVRDVEPWLAVARLHGVAAGALGADVALLDEAWRPLLRCLPHDTLCGCSTDAVARAMDARLDDADAQARGLRADALDALVGHDAVAARAARDRWTPMLVVRNRAGRARGGVAQVTLDAFVRDVGVGPGSGGHWRPAVEAPRTAHPCGSDGRPLPVQRLAKHRTPDRLDSPRHYPDVDLVDRSRALVWVPPVPALGLATFPLDVRAPHEGVPSEVAVDEPAHPARAHGTTLTNGLVEITADVRGRVRLSWPALGVTWDDCLGVEDVADAGDLYTPSLVGAVRAHAWCDAVRLTQRGPLRAELALALRLRVPAALAPADDGLSRPTRPLRRHVELPLVVTLALDADAPFVRLAVRGENRARDHRLRLVVRTPHAGARVVADAAFGPVERARTASPASTDARPVEAPLATAPLHRWVALADEAATGDPSPAALLVSDGLAEYEARADGALCVTLVRAVGELSRPDLPERPGHAGWPTRTPEAQGEGPFEAAFALVALAVPAHALPAVAERVADDALLPLVGVTRRDLLAPPAFVPGPQLDGDGLAVLAVHPAPDGRMVRLRCVNLLPHPVAGAWRLPMAVSAASRLRLDGMVEARLSVEPLADGGARVSFEAAPRAPITIEVAP